ncbi:MAG: hypothetical protein P8R42_14400 [Candidatus Binatia bacterium]|nr:hypothetical protein [Candidatus Binatia bacterium]
MDSSASHEVREEARTEVIDCYRGGFGVLLDYPVMLLVPGFVVSALVVAAWGFVSVPFVGGILGFIFAALVSTPLAYGFAYQCLRAVRDDVAEPGDVAEVYDRYFEAVVAAALSTGLVLVGFAFLVVPGIFLLCRFAFVPYLVVEGRLSAVDALFESFERTRGHGWTILGIGICRMVLLVIGSASFGLLMVPAAVWSDLAMASLYHRVVSGTPPPDLY